MLDRRACRRGEHADQLPQVLGPRVVGETAAREQRVHVCQIAGNRRDAEDRVKVQDGPELAVGRVKVTFHYVRGPRAALRHDHVDRPRSPAGTTAAVFCALRSARPARSASPSSAAAIRSWLDRDYRVSR